MRMTLTKEFTFEASHQLPNHDGKCARLHGHSWRLKVGVMGSVNERVSSPKQGMVMDYADIKFLIQPIIDILDHRHLGSGEVGPQRQWLPPDIGIPEDFPKVPTSENILIWIAGQFPREFPWLFLELAETCTTTARLWREAYYAEQ